MNRHKAYWSVMGNEPNIEQSVSSKKHDRHKEQLLKMINQYNGDGVNEILKIIREIMEENRNE